MNKKKFDKYKSVILFWFTYIMTFLIGMWTGIIIMGVRLT